MPRLAIPAIDVDLYDRWRASVNSSAIACAWSKYAIDALPVEMRARAESLDATLTRAFDEAIDEMWAREVDAINDVAELGENLGVCESWGTFRMRGECIAKPEGCDDQF